MEDAAVVYNTFSTIAKSLASALALLGAFVLYRMQTLQMEIGRRSEALLQVGPDAARDAHARGDYRGVMEITDVQITTPDRNVDYARRRLKALFAHEQALMRAFWLAVILTVSVITISVFVISRVPEILSAGLHGRVIDAGLWAFVACLGSYAWLLRAALRSTSHHER